LIGGDATTFRLLPFVRTVIFSSFAALATRWFPEALARWRSAKRHADALRG
jgi:hypothetical protein